MRAMRAEGFGGYQDLKPVEMPKPSSSEGRLLVRMTAAGVTPLDHTILAGHFPLSSAPLVLGNEGAGIIEGGDSDFPDGSRVMFTGPFGVFENGFSPNGSRCPRTFCASSPTMWRTPPPPASRWLT